MKVMICALLAAVVLAGCSSSTGPAATPATPGATAPDTAPIMHMKDFDITEADFTTGIRAVLLEPGSQQFCQGLQGLSLDEIIAAVREFTADDESTELPTNATPRPGQLSDEPSRQNAARILSDECDRILR